MKNTISDSIIAAVRSVLANGDELSQSAIADKMDWSAVALEEYKRTYELRDALVAMVKAEEVACNYRVAEPMYHILPRPNRFAHRRAKPRPPLGRVLRGAEMAPFLDVLLGCVRSTENIPVEVVVCEPTMCVPKQARVFETEFVRLRNGLVVTADEAFESSRVIHQDGWAIRGERVLCAEVWEDHGDDGHTSFRHEGWAFVTESEFASAMTGAGSENRWRGCRYTVALESLISRE